MNSYILGDLVKYSGDFGYMDFARVLISKHALRDLLKYLNLDLMARDLKPLIKKLFLHFDQNEDRTGYNYIVEGYISTILHLILGLDWEIIDHYNGKPSYELKKSAILRDCLTRYRRGI